MKILSVHWGYSIGGVGKYASIIDHVGEYQDIQMKTICIVSRNRQVDVQTLESLGDKTIVWRESAFDLKWFKELKRVINSWQPDCFMSHGFNGHFITTIAKLFTNKKPKIICSYHGLYHATTPMRYLPGYIYNRFTEFYIRNIAASAVAVAGHCKTYLLTKNINDSKINVIHNGISDYSTDATVRLTYRKIFNVEDDETLLGIASRLDPVKGLDYLVTAFFELQKTHNKTKLIIIGTGTVEQSLQARCEALGIKDKVVFTGFRDDIPDCLTAIDIFVLPSLAEYHSIGLLEAMRAEKPIVATDVGGNTESVRDNKEGLIVESKNAKQLESAITELIEDSDKAVRLASAARKRFLENFTEEVMIKKTAAWIIDSVK